MPQAAAREDIRHSLRTLSPEGVALKRHLLGQLLGHAPSPLTAAEVSADGPKRTDASVRYALKALQRIGVVAQTRPTGEQNKVIRFTLTPGAEDVVRAFLADEPADEERFPISPLPVLPRYQRMLTVFYDNPAKPFTVMSMCDKVRRKEAAVRRGIQELHEAGYLTRALSDANSAGRRQFVYRLNPDAVTYAFALVHGTAR